MVRQIKYNHNVVVSGSDDATKQVSKDAWNDGHNESGMFGWGSITTLTVATGAITPVNSAHKIDGEGASADELDNITNTETAEFDELWLFGGAQTITLRDNSISGGNIYTLSGNNLTLSTTVPTKIIRVSTNWYEVGGSGSGVFADNVFAVQDEGDQTKQFNISIGGATTSTTTTFSFAQTVSRTITFPDATDTVAVLGLAQTFTADQTLNDNINLTFGTGGDADIDYDGTNMYINPAVVGTGDLKVTGGSLHINDDNESLAVGAGQDLTISHNATDNIINAVNGKLIIQDGGTAVATFDTTDGIVMNERFQTLKGADVASTGIMTLGNDGNVFDITGTTTINEIVPTNWQSGSIITLQFDGALQVTHNSGGTNDILLGNQANWTTQAGDAIMLFYNGTDWVEIARSEVGGAGGSDTPWTVNHDFDVYYFDMQVQSAPANPATDNGRIYLKTIDASNDGLFMKVKKNGSFTEVQIA